MEKEYTVARVSNDSILQCRVHALERMCLSDVAEINRIHQQLHVTQRSTWALRESMLQVSLSGSAVVAPENPKHIPALCLS